MSDVVVREPRDGDREALRRLALEAVTPDVVAAGGRFDPGDTDHLLSADVIFVAECGHHLSGYVAVSEDGDVLCVDRLVVAITDEGRGVGHRLLDWAEGYAVSRGKHAVRVRVEPGNRRAREFYARRGYAEDGAQLERPLAHA
jgi:GNAT superfamily N-acetyltransferase